jgi:peroxiredoxin
MDSQARWLGTALVALACTLAPTGRLAAESVAAKPTAAELIKGVANNEGKLYQLSSARIRMEEKSSLSPARMAEVKAKTGKDVRPEAMETNEVAFDATRVRSRREMNDIFGDTRITLDVWNGETRKQYSLRRTNGSEVSRYDLSSSMLHGFAGVPLAAFQLEPRRFWWSQLAQASRLVTPPEDYVLGGEEIFHGRPCYRLDCPRGMQRVFVGAADRRLYGIVRFSPPGEPEELALQSRVAGRQFATVAEAREALAQLSEDEQGAFRARCDRERFGLGHPNQPAYLDDYREVAPGVWLPMTRESDGVVRKIVEFQIDPPLTAAQFDIEIPVGTTVWDTRQEVWPPLNYEYKASFTDGEWQAITAPRAKELAENARGEAILRQRVGQTVPEFLPGTWLNSEPLALKDLRGKMVLLEFTSYSCPPCTRYIPTLSELHRESRDSGLVVIAIHVADKDTPRIKQYIDDNAIEYPLYVDADARNQKFWGRTFQWFQLDGTPGSVLIDAKGKVVACGGLEDVLFVAHKLALPKP